MVKVKITERYLEKEMKRRIRLWKRDELEQEQSAKIIRKELAKNLTEGIGGDDEPLPGLQDSTIDHREYLETTRTKRSKRYKGADFSNATFSGQLIGSLKVVAEGLGVFSFFAVGTRKPYKTRKGKDVKGDTPTNADVFRQLKKRGWVLYGVTNNAKAAIAKRVKKFLGLKKSR